MNKVYTDILPEDYFDNLFEKVSGFIRHGENVCISVMYGQSNKTVFQFLFRLILEKKLFDKVEVYNPVLFRKSLVDFVKKAVKKNPKQNKLIILRFFEQTQGRRGVLEKLKALQDHNRQRLTYLAIADYSALLNPIEYTANSTVFFSDCIYIPPYSFKQTSRMIETLTEFYGWKINKSDYKKIFLLSGGNTRIIKYICKEIAHKNIPLANPSFFTSNMNISFELDYLAKILISESEENLKKLGLLGDNHRIKSKLLRDYFRSYKLDLVGKTYPNLSENETRILSYLLAKDGDAISVDKIAQISKMTAETFSLWAIYKTMSRLKGKIKKKYKIKSIRNRGYYLSKVN